MSGAPAPVRAGLFREDPPALIASRCDRCGALRFPALDFCASCRHRGATEVELAERGTVYTYTVVHAAPPGYGGEVPYAPGVVELPEGIRVAATLLADDLAAIEIGAPCRLELIEIPGGDGATLRSYAFRVEGGS